MKTLIGLVITVAIVGILVTMATRGPPAGRRMAEPLDQKMRVIRTVWAEHFATSMAFPDSNAEANSLFPGHAVFGPQTEMGSIVGFNATPGGIIEIQLKQLDDNRQPLRAVLIPRVLADGRIDGFACVSHNWESVAGLYRDCRFDRNGLAAEAVHRTQLAALKSPTPTQPIARPEWQAYEAARRAEEAMREADARAMQEREQRAREADAAAEKARADLDATRAREAELREQQARR